MVLPFLFSKSFTFCHTVLISSTFVSCVTDLRFWKWLCFCCCVAGVPLPFLFIASCGFLLCCAPLPGKPCFLVHIWKSEHFPEVFFRVLQYLIFRGMLFLYDCTEGCSHSCAVWFLPFYFKARGTPVRLGEVPQQGEWLILGLGSCPLAWFHFLIASAPAVESDMWKSQSSFSYLKGFPVM